MCTNIWGEKFVCVFVGGGVTFISDHGIHDYS